MKKKKSVQTSSLTDNHMIWEQIKGYPTLVIQTVRGPVFVKVGATNDKYIRGFAPAFATFSEEATRVAFLPVGFAETFIDFRMSGIMGTNDVPAALEIPYAGYVDRFANGDYQLKEIPVQIDPDAEVVSVDVMNSGEAAPIETAITQ
jgi:hypothetical protein